MMNIEQLTNRLAQMPDQALQQYAMMNKEDPYIMALALSESRRRKQMRTAAAPQQQAQPKVADQALMEMSPAGGVDALPTEEMNFAGGGIVAFADGGDVERYQAGGSLTGETLDAARARAQAAQQRLYTYGLRQRQQDPAGFQTAQQELAAAQAALQNAEQGYAAEMSASGAGRAAFGMPTAPMMPAPAAPAADNLSGMDRRLMAGSQPSIASVKTPLPPKAPAGLGATPEAAALQKSPAAPAAGAPTVQGAKDLAGQFYDTEAQKAEIDKYMAEQRADVAAARERRNEGKPTGKAYSKYEEMLQGEEGRAGKERDEATGVAIFKAGLAMMGGTSPRAFENISKGALTGLDEYTSAMKDMKKAAKERQKAFADIENARRAEDREDWKSAQAFEDKAATRLDKAREFGVKSIMDVTGKSADIASAIYKTGVEQQGAFQRAKLQADAMRDRGGSAGERQQLAELKALQTNLKDQLKDARMMGPKGDPIRAQLAQVNDAIAKMAGLGTMTGAPGVTSPGGIPSDVQALLNKYGGK
jgi:hypothetical protein